MRIAVMAACAALCAALGAFAAGEEAILGVWTVQSGDARVEIAKAADGTFEGKIVWIVEPNYDKDDPEAGKPRHDRKNPDPAKRSQPIVGLRILDGFKQDGENVWKGGNVYDPDEGKTYKCKLTLVDADHLDVRGFIGFAALGRNDHWTRYIEKSK